MKNIFKKTHDSNTIQINKKNALFIYGLLLWPLIHFCVFWIYIHFSTVLDAFYFFKMDGSRVFCGFENFGKVFTEILFNSTNDNINNYRALLNTMSLIPLSLLVNLPLTLFFAYFIYKKVACFKIYRILLFIPSVVSSVVLCLLFSSFVSDSGPFNLFLAKIGLAGDGTGNNPGIIPVSGWLQTPATGWKTIIVFSVLTGISGYLIYFTSAMGRLPVDVLESAELDGASEIREFFSIVMPMIWPTLTTISVSFLASIFGWFMPTFLLTGGNNKYTTTIGLVVVQSVKSGSTSGTICAMGVIISIFGGFLVLLFKYFMERAFSEVQY